MYFLLLTSAERRIVVLTEKDMFENCMKEVPGGRIPTSIALVHAAIPAELEARLRDARAVAAAVRSPMRLWIDAGVPWSASLKRQGPCWVMRRKSANHRNFAYEL
jgi:hypothetical protein